MSKYTRENHGGELILLSPVEESVGHEEGEVPVVVRHGLEGGFEIGLEELGGPSEGEEEGDGGEL
ncbi:hypothetical protein Dimus_011267, partial [Dionaea muscipula]